MEGARDWHIYLASKQQASKAKHGQTHTNKQAARVVAIGAAGEKFASECIRIRKYAEEEGMRKGRREKRKLSTGGLCLTTMT